MEDQAAFDRYYAQLVTTECNKVDGWVNAARNLLSAAEAVMVMTNAGRELMGQPNVRRSADEDKLASRSVQTTGPLLMLYAFAIECLFKAYHLKNGGTIYTDGRVDKRSAPNPRPAHDLERLCAAVGLLDSFDDAQHVVLDRLTLFTETGRYPGPADFTRYGHRVNSDGTGYMRGMWSTSCEVTTYSIFEVLYGLLEEPIPDYAAVLLVADSQQHQWRRALQARGQQQ